MPWSWPLSSSLSWIHFSFSYHLTATYDPSTILKNYHHLVCLDYPVIQLYLLIIRCLVVGLSRNIEIPKWHDTPYSLNHNETQRDELWESIDINIGIVALDQDLITAQKLPLSMEFPWDSSKNVYSTTAHHQLHCLKKLYKSVSQSFQGRNQTENSWHLMHCLDALRQDTLCNSDDVIL